MEKTIFRLPKARSATNMRSATHDNRVNNLILLVCDIGRKATSMLLRKTPERNSLVYFKLRNIKIE